MFGYGRVGYFMSEFSLILMLDKVLVWMSGTIVLNRLFNLFIILIHKIYIYIYIFIIF
jgi:hypothetical protein